MRKYKPYLIFLAVVFITACTPIAPIDNPQPSVYFWKTVFDPDSTEAAFINDFGIRKIYMRYFDVVFDQDKNALMPNATLQFRQPVPENVEVIPVVFIVEKCLRHNVDSIAEMLVDRVVKMSETNHVPKIHEFQIDCDWTAKSEKVYFPFLQKVKDYAAAKGLKLSVTIRLHQLNMAAPPCDYGVLMLYNTGNYANRKCVNPILYYNDVKPFLRHLKKYPLRMCVAFPNFKWQILFKKGKYSNILYSENLDDTLNFARIDSATFFVQNARDIPMYIGNEAFNVMLNYGDTIFVRKAEFSEIEKVRAALNEYRPEILSQTIIYDLNSNNINNINYQQYEKIFSGSIAADRANQQ